MDHILNRSDFLFKVNVCSGKDAFNGVMIIVWTPMLYDDR
jgi:hypothetical protein